MSRRPLDGLRVADFSWFAAGPIAARTMADFGAEVVRVESTVHLDGLRTVQPAALGPDGLPVSPLNTSGFFNNFNAGKLSLTLNLNTERGQEVGYRLIETSDIFITNFTPRVIAKWRLSYEQIAAVNPRIIAAYAPMQGLDGPHRDFLGFGAILTPLAGISEMSGSPDEPPYGVGTNYPDYVVNPGHLTVAILAALRHLRRTGQGQRIELSQLEAVVATLGTAVPEYLANGTIPTRMSNRHLAAAPHGAFRCREEDDEHPGGRWIAIACREDAHWAALCAALGHAGIANDPRFATLAARKANEDALEALVSEWTAPWVVEELAEHLQSHGVPAAVIQNARDILERDEHLRVRGHYRYLDHPEAGRTAYDGPVPQLSRTPGELDSPSPLIGEHTFEVCERILGMEIDEIATLVAEGILV